MDVEGVLLPRFSKDQSETEILVPVTSARGHLQNLALAITSSLPVLISGPVGCGKFKFLFINQILEIKTKLSKHIYFYR